MAFKGRLSFYNDLFNEFEQSFKIELLNDGEGSNDQCSGAKKIQREHTLENIGFQKIDAEYGFVKFFTRVQQIPKQKRGGENSYGFDPALYDGCNSEILAALQHLKANIVLEED